MDGGAWWAAVLGVTKSWTQLSNLTFTFMKMFLPQFHADLAPISGPCAEGDGTPLQCSCLENPMDGGAWWAAVRGVANSWT